MDRQFGEILCTSFISQDYNRDYQLKFDGFQATMLLPEFGFRPEQVQEIFQCIQSNQIFYYKDFILEHNPDLSYLFVTKPTIQKVTQSPIKKEESIVIESKPSVSSIQTIKEGNSISNIG